MKASVMLLAFGRSGYVKFAANLIASLRHFGYSGEIHLHIDGRLREFLPSWAAKECTLHELIGEDPALAKLSICEKITGPTLYIDADTVALGDITPFIEALEKDGRDFIAQVQGKGKTGEKIEYFEWAEQQTCIEKHDLKDPTFYGLQSSWMFLRSGAFLTSFAEVAHDCFYHWDPKELKHTWAGGKPDELFWSLACTILGHDPSFHIDPINFGTGHSLPEIKEKHLLLSLYGRKGQVRPRFTEYYDTVMRQVSKAAGRHHEYKAGELLKHKICNHNKPQRHGMFKLQRQAS